MTFGSLFAGIGGFDLGFERAGMRCVWQVEIDPYCRKVLSKHWPDVPKWDDVKTFTGEGFERPDVICGGFPCQDISNAGKRAGIDGERSGLWSEYARIIRVVRPRFVVVENVAALLSRGMDTVLGDLAEMGLDAEWGVFPAAAFGAPHIRERVFLLAYPVSERTGNQCGTDRGQGRQQTQPPEPEALRQTHGPTCAGRADTGGCSLPNAKGIGRRAGRAGRIAGAGKRKEDSASMAYAPIIGSFDGRRKQREEGGEGERDDGQWSVEPAVGRVADGVPHRMDRLKGLGNAVVPQIAEWIGRRLMEASSQEKAQ